MSLLTVIQDAALEIGIKSPTSVVSASTDAGVQQLLALFNRCGQAIRSEYDWPQLTKEYTFTLATSTASYIMPPDFDRFAFSTFWDRTNNWEMIGPMSESDWQFLKSGVTTSGARRRFRFKDSTTKQFYLDPTPSSSDNGATMVFEYYSKNWLRPKLWVTSTAFSAGSYCFYNGNFYSTVAGGTTGATPPTHTTGSASDGTVAWVYLTAAYERATADTDVCLIDESIITQHLKWRIRQARGLDGWQDLKAEADMVTHRLAGANRGAANLNLNAARYLRGYLADPSTPDTGFGS